MPFTLLSHQTPILPLKAWKPRWFSGTALVFGSMAPDLEYVIRGDAGPVDGHTVFGQFLFCLPLTILLVYVTRLFLARPLAAHLPDAGRFHLRDVGAVANVRFSPRDLARVVTSSLIGSFSHIFLDGFTHWRGWAVTRIAFLQSTAFVFRGEPIPVYRVLQLEGSVVLAAISLAMLYAIGRRRLLLKWARIATGDSSFEANVIPVATRQSKLRFFGMGLGFAAFGFATRMYHDLSAVDGGFSVTFLGYELMQACCFAYMGFVIAALLFGEGAPRARVGNVEAHAEESACPPGDLSNR